MADDFDRLSDEDKADLRKRLDAMVRSGFKEVPKTAKGPAIKFKKPHEVKDVPVEPVQEPSQEQQQAVEQPVTQDEPTADVPVEQNTDNEPQADVPVEQAKDDEPTPELPVADVHDEPAASNEQDAPQVDAATDNATPDEIRPDDDEPQQQQPEDERIQLLLEGMRSLMEDMAEVKGMLEQLPKILDDMQRID